MALASSCIPPDHDHPLIRFSTFLTQKLFTAFVFRAQHIVRRLKHPNICAYVGVCIAAPRFSLVYEYLEHGSLSERLRHVPGTSLSTTKQRSCPGSSDSDRGGAGGGDLSPLGTATLLRVGEDVAEGMHYLHQVDILLKRACCRICCVVEARSRLSPHANRQMVSGACVSPSISVFRGYCSKCLETEKTVSHMACMGITF